MRPHVDAFDPVFGDGFAPGGIAFVQRDIEEHDLLVSHLRFDLPEKSQVADTRPAPTCPEIQEYRLLFELTQGYWLAVEVGEGKVGGGLP